MDKIEAINILHKYKNNLPFEYNLFCNEFLNGNIDALIYMSNLIKHDKYINERNCSRPIIRIISPDIPHDDNLIYNRLNYCILSDNTSYFAGYF